MNPSTLCDTPSQAIELSAVQALTEAARARHDAARGAIQIPVGLFMGPCGAAGHFDPGLLVSEGKLLRRGLRDPKAKDLTARPKGKTVTSQRL